MAQMRFFFNPKSLNIEWPPNSSNSLAVVNSAQAHRIHQMNQVYPNFVRSAEIDNSEGIVQDHEEYITIPFNNMQVRRIQRSDRREVETVVTEEKFAILYRTSVKIDDEVFEIWKLSLPIVVIVHGTQESQAWGPIFWVI